MNGHTHGLNWLRLPNLLIVALTQYILYYFFVREALINRGLEERFDAVLFLFLVIVTLIITLSGYIINDYLDEKIDLINKPEKSSFIQILGKKTSLTYYFIIVLSGFSLSIFIAIQTHFLKELWIYPTAIVLLYLYSRYFKYHPFWGNIIVSLFCAGVIFLIYYIEFEAIRNLSIIDSVAYKGLNYLFLFYCAFAILSNYIRELIKDLEDMHGDKMHGAKSFPIFAGIKSTRYYINFLSLVLTFVLCAWLYQGIIAITYLNIIFITVFILAPLLYINIKIHKANPDYHHLSLWTKGLMLAGLINLLFYQQVF